MNIENPLHTIKKAVEEAAIRKASNEFLEKPEARHFQLVFDDFKRLRNLNPQVLARLIIRYAKTKELKDELGRNLDFTLQQVYNEKSSQLEDRIIAGIEQLQSMSKMKQEEVQKEFAALMQRGAEELGRQIKTDSRITSSFVGKEELLNKAINFINKELLETLYDLNKYVFNSKLNED